MKFSALALALGIASSSAFSPSSFGVTRQQRVSITSLDARKPFISGNWKLNPSTKEEAVTLAKDIAASITDDSPDADVALFVPYVFIESAKAAAGKSSLEIGAELCFYEEKGAFTGGVSTSQLKSVGVQWCLAGHSERRTVFGESDEDINKQCKKLIADGMSVMLCIGESEAEYEENLASAVCAIHMKKGLSGIKKEDMDRVAIAYEPVWAIGTGKVATPETAQSVHAACRKILAEMYDQETADATRILYGGSVTPESVDELMSQPDIDGCLVGGASLDAKKFGRIINFKAPVAV